MGTAPDNTNAGMITLLILTYLNDLAHVAGSATAGGGIRHHVIDVLPITKELP
jgi:hypothetical protein